MICVCVSVSTFTLVDTPSVSPAVVTESVSNRQLFERAICFHIEYIMHRCYLLPSKNVFIAHDLKILPQESK